MKKIVKILIIPITLLQGCSKSIEDKTSIHTKKILRCGLSTDITTFDPGKSGDSYTNMVVSQCFESLMQLDEKGNVVPNLAENVDTSEDGKTYTFHIKKGIKFHNGDELTAQDFKWTFERNLNKSFNSPTAFNFLGDIEGVKAYQEGKVSEIVGIKVLNPHKLQLKIEEPRGYFLHKLTYTVTSALNHKATPKTEIIRKEDIIGTGPFRVLEHIKNSLVKLEANKNYHGDKPNIANLEYFVVQDNTILLNKIKKGDLDFTEISLSDVDKLREDSDLKNQLVEFTDNGFSYLEFNPKLLPILKNMKLRLALAHAIDQEELVNEVLNGNAIPAHYLIPQGIAASRSGKGVIHFDPDQAKKLLKETNIDPKDLNMSIVVSAKSPTAKKVAEYISVQLRKILGINIDIQSLSWGTYLSKMGQHKIPLRYASWGLDYPDPSNVITSLFESKSSLNYTGYNNSIFDKLARKADASANSVERNRLYQQAEDILLEEGIVIPLFVSKRYWWVNKNIKGIRYTIKGCMPHNKVIIYT